MNNAIQSFEVLYNNPFILGPLFPEFYRSLGSKPNGILLSFLILPLALHPESQKYLKNANGRSSLRILVSDRQRLFGLPSRIEQYRSLTTTCLQYAMDSGAISIDGDLSIKLTGRSLSVKDCPPNSMKAANQLGVLLAPFDIPTAFRMLGVKKL